MILRQTRRHNTASVCVLSTSGYLSSSRTWENNCENLVFLGNKLTKSCSTFSPFPFFFPGGSESTLLLFKPPPNHLHAFIWARCTCCSGVAQKETHATKSQPCCVHWQRVKAKIIEFMTLYPHGVYWGMSNIDARTQVDILWVLSTPLQIHNYSPPFTT